MTITGLDRIDRNIEIHAAPDRVWRALTNPRKLSTWFQVAIEGSIEPGNEVWHWHPGAVDPVGDYSLEPPTTVAFTRVSAHGTLLTVSETGFDEASLANSRDEALTRLKALTED